MRLLRLYVAGAMRDPDSGQFLENLRLGQALARWGINRGFACFIPFNDFPLFFHGEVDVPKLMASSASWLEVSDAVLLQPLRAELSKGTAAELARAKELGIPNFSSKQAILRWRRAVIKKWTAQSCADDMKTPVQLTQKQIAMPADAVGEIAKSITVETLQAEADELMGTDQNALKRELLESMLSDLRGAT